MTKDQPKVRIIKVEPFFLKPCDSLIGFHYQSGFETIEEVETPFWEISLGIGLASLKITGYNLK